MTQDQYLFFNLNFKIPLQNNAISGLGEREKAIFRNAGIMLRLWTNSNSCWFIVIEKLTFEIEAKKLGDIEVKTTHGLVCPKMNIEL